MKNSYGTVYIVGAGPGSPELITLRGAECLRRADVVMYDRLAHPALLLQASEHAKLIYCGKKPCAHTLRQEDIQHEMIVQAKHGKKVVRLKGGDPSIFGRMAEEMEELSARRIPYEIVPGITAGSAAASYAGVSLTHRHHAHGYRVLTGHGQGASLETVSDWENLAATTDTIIWYMGMKRLPIIANQLIKHGKPPETNVLVVEWASHRQQRTADGTLDTIVSLIDEKKMNNPSIIIIGEVTKQHEELQWFAPSSIGGILAFPQNEVERRAYEQLKALGLEVFINPVLSEDCYYFENTFEIMDRLLDEGFIRHIIMPSTKEGKQFYNSWRQRNIYTEQPLSCWMAGEKKEPAVLSSLLPILPLERADEWPGYFLAEENGRHIDLNGKASG
ncbi:uroporphyrinogen-III C-methyltransferase [Salibacterium aidingense]|uniref:uroporphyrinogen-III C-methyltransferase n=1 Tax=Salibacterium aidingense TaxID=384933 RepID=UPI003BE1C9EC